MTKIKKKEMKHYKCDKHKIGELHPDGCRCISFDYIDPCLCNPLPPKPLDCKHLQPRIVNGECSYCREIRRTTPPSLPSTKEWGIHDILADFIIDLCEGRRMEKTHVCQPTDKIYQKTYKRISDLLAQREKETVGKIEGYLITQTKLDFREIRKILAKLKT